jgi:general secretion pathway protein G
MKEKSGFTLIELMVVIAIIGILGVVITPVISKAIDKARVAKAVKMAGVLETAASAYYLDNGEYAFEWGDEAVISPSNHNLYYKPGSAYINWDGPYIKRPLGRQDNPFPNDYRVRVMPNLTHFITGGNGAYEGFDLDSDGTPDATGPGNFLFFSGVTRKQGLMVNNIIDSEANLTDTDWERQGQVEWMLYSDSNNLVCIYLLGGY